MATHRSVTFKEAYDAIRKNLIDRLTLHERQAMLLLNSDAPPIPIGVDGDAGTFYGVSPGDMFYPDFAGHPTEHCTVEAGVEVTSVTRIWTDDANSEQQALFDAERGLLVKQPQLIYAMVAPFATLALADGSGDTFLHDTMRPVGSAKPASGTLANPDGEEEDVPVYFQTLRFIATFDVKLS